MNRPFSEIALALKHGKDVITLGYDVAPLLDRFPGHATVSVAWTPEEAIALIQKLRKSENRR